MVLEGGGVEARASKAKARASSFMIVEDNREQDRITMSLRGAEILSSLL